MDYRDRLARAQELMRSQGLDWLVVAPSADLTYLTGVDAHPGDRLTALLLPAEGTATLLAPAFEAAALDQSTLPADLLAWPDGADPVALALDRLDTSGAPGASGASSALGVSDSLWARDLLPILAARPGARVTLATPVLRPLRLVKDEAEIDLLRRAGRAADRVFERIAGAGLAGRTELEVADLLRAFLIEEGHDAMGFGIVGSGPNGALPHHHTGTRRIAGGDLVVLDFGGTIDGYFSDITRTVAVGEPAPEARAVYAAVQAAQETGVRAVRPGVPAASVDTAVRTVLEQAGYGPYFVHRTGHGLGLEAHEPPYLVAGDETELRPGMVMSVEPGVYLPGRFGVRIEDIVVVTADGAERLNNADRELHVVA